MKPLAVLASVLVSGLVVLDIAGLVDVVDDDSDPSRRAERLPAEYLYLDDERVYAYLGQLRRGLSPAERRTLGTKRTQQATVGQGVAQVGATRELQATIEQTVSPKAADRYYELETELKDSFQVAEGESGVTQAFRRVRANPAGCSRIGDPTVIHEGEIVRITGAKLQAPTYALPLAKLAHAAQYRNPSEDAPSAFVTREELTRLARRYQKPLARYLEAFGTDPRLVLRLNVRGRKVRGGKGARDCDILFPVRYSKLSDAPSLLTGRVTIVGKVVRRLTNGDPRYFDVETAVTYGTAVRDAHREIKQVLQLAGKSGSSAVEASAIARYPGLVVLPLAMYK